MKTTKKIRRDLKKENDKKLKKEFKKKLTRNKK